MKRLTPYALLASAGAVLFFSACDSSGNGVKPDPNAIYFPVALAMTGDAGERSLSVLNSDFDLQFNRGTLQSLDVERLREIARRPCKGDDDCSSGQICDVTASEKNEGVPSFFCVDESGEYAGLPCGPFPVNSGSARGFSPGRCGAVKLATPQDDPNEKKKPLITDSLFVSAFGTDILAVRPPGGGSERLFVPVRGEASVEWIDVEKGKYRCGQSAEKECGPEYRVREANNVEVDNILYAPKDGSVGNVDSGTLPPEPYGIAATQDGERIVLTHQNAILGPNISGKVSAILNRWGDEPRFVSIQAGLSLNPLGVTAIPMAKIDAQTEHEPGFFVSFRADPRIQLVRFYDDGALGAGGESAIDSARPFVRAVGSAPILTNSSGLDSRGILVDDTARKSAEAACGDDADCLRVAADVSLDVYVANRSPASLLLGRTKRSVSSGAATDYPTFYDNITLTEGPSRVLLGYITNAEGKKERRIFVLCFDSSSIFVVDPVRRRIESQFATGRGPQALVFDPDEPLAYVAHFTDSYLGVISLNQEFPQTYGAMLAMIGAPTRPRAAK